MRFPTLFAGTLLLLACGDTVPSRARAPSSDERAAAPRLARAGVSAPAAPPPDGLPAPVLATAAPLDPAALRDEGASGVMGALENPAALRRFYEALAGIESGQSHDDAVVLQFGDSHTAADYETGPLRRALQTRFGDGGRGFVPIGNLWKHYVQEGVRNGNTNEWAGVRARPARHGAGSAGSAGGDGMCGLTGVALHTTHGGARAWCDSTAKTSRVDVAYLAQPRGGSFDVLVDGARVARVSTRAAAAASAWRSLDVVDGAHRVEVVAVGDGDVRIFGAVLDRESVGVMLDALGINGARVTNALAWDEAHMAEQIRHRAPDLVVLAYGTNESGDSDVPIEAYERQLVDLLGRIARAAPSASCLLLGPPDRAFHTSEGWGTLPRLLDVIATQRRVARAAGCAFFDQLEAMGGPGTIAQWAEEPQPRANRDRVHLTREGYSQLGNAVAADLIRGYATWRAEQPPPAEDPVNVASLPSLPPR